MSSKLFLFGSIAIALLLSLLFISKSTIQVSSVNGSFYLKEDSFELGWIHSVEKEPWFEQYERQGEQLLLTTTRFKTFGAGTPSEGVVIPSTDGFVHMEVDQSMEALRLAVSENVETTLIVGDEEIPLYQGLPDHEVVIIEVVDARIWQLWKGRFE